MSIVPLKLAALDEADLAVVSAHVQDAVVKVADVSWAPAQRRLMVPMNRFAWERTTGRRVRGQGDERRRAILQFDKVDAVRAKGAQPGEGDTVLSILALSFIEGEAPSGTVRIICSGETEFRLDVECIEVRLTDLGAAWAASARPKHRAV